MPKARTGNGKNAISSANSVATAPASRALLCLRGGPLGILITREPHRARKTKIWVVPTPAVLVCGKNAAMAVVVMLTELTLGPQTAVTKFAKAVFNGCVRTTWTALGSVPVELDVLHELPTVNP